MVYITTNQIRVLCEAAKNCLEGERRYNDALCIQYEYFERHNIDRSKYIYDEYEAGLKAGLKAMALALRGKGMPQWLGYTLGRVIAAGRIQEIGWNVLSEITYFGQSDFGQVTEVTDDSRMFLLSPNGERLKEVDTDGVEGVEWGRTLVSFHKGRRW